MTTSTKSYSSSIDRVAPGPVETAADQIVNSLIGDPFTRKVIHRRVTQLLRMAEFASDTEDDLTQEFLIRLTDAMKHHSDEVGHRNPYIVSVVDRFTATLMEHRRAMVRYTADGVSLDQRISDTEIGPVSFVDMLSQCDQERRLQTCKLEVNERTNLKFDLAAVMDQLSENEQRFLNLLRGHTVTEVAQIMELPRSTLVSWLEKIATIFEEAGLREYLP